MQNRENCFDEISLVKQGFQTKTTVPRAAEERRPGDGDREEACRDDLKRMHKQGIIIMKTSLLSRAIISNQMKRTLI